MWLIYALGGGWGHLTRAIALERAARRTRPVRILTNSPYAGIARAALPDLDLVAIDPDSPPAQTRTAVVSEIAGCRPSCLIVDTFPRGLGGELKEVLDRLGVPKVLVHRDLNPRYVEQARLRDFAAAHYDLILVPGAGEGSQLGDLPKAVETSPWLVRSAGEIPRREPGEDSCILVCAAGKSGELAWYAEVAIMLRERAPVRVISAECPAGCPKECWMRYWPAMDLFGGARVVVGGAGYNTIEECLASRVPLVARPWRRLYDRQQDRAKRAAQRGRVTAVIDPNEAVAAVLAFVPEGSRGPAEFVNGAKEAVRRIDWICGSRLAGHREYVSNFSGN